MTYLAVTKAGIVLGWYVERKRAERALLAFGPEAVIEERVPPTEVLRDLERLARL